MMILLAPLTIRRPLPLITPLDPEPIKLLLDFTCEKSWCQIKEKFAQETAKPKQTHSNSEHTCIVTRKLLICPVQPAGAAQRTYYDTAAVGAFGW